MQGESPPPASAPAGIPLLSALKRWISLRVYGVVTSTLFGATTSPQTMRGRFERFGRVTQPLTSHCATNLFQRTMRALDVALDGIKFQPYAFFHFPSGIYLIFRNVPFWYG